MGTTSRFDPKTASGDHQGEKTVSSKQPQGYVRAKPRKISLTETYHYRAEIQDATNFQFEKAEGQIKVEFIYDGERRDGRWKMRQFLDSLPKRFKLLHRLERSLRWFLHLGLVEWITRLTRLAWLWGKFEQLLLGKKPDDKKYFGISAVKDAAKCGQGYPTARVGHLVLHDYDPSNFKQEWPKQQTVPLEIPIEGLKRNLERTRQFSLSYKYEPKEPAAPPLHLPVVKLSDVGWDGRGERHSHLDEVLRFGISLALDASQPGVDESDELSQEVIERWWHDLRKEELNKEEMLEQYRQVYLLDGLDDTSAIERAMYNLATRRGGYILLQPKKSNEDKEANLRQLRHNLLQIALSEGPVFVPVLRPYHRPVDNRVVYVVPVPMVPPRWYDERPERQDPIYESKLWVSGTESKFPEKTIKIAGKGDNVDRELAETLAALANSQGGSVLLKVADDQQFCFDDVYQGFIYPACFLCWPPLDLNLMQFFEYRGKTIWLIEIERPSPEVHSVSKGVDKVIYRWENGRMSSLSPSNEDDIEGIYQLFKDRCNLSYPIVEPRPVVFHADLHGPRFDARDYHGSTYSREDEALKWTDEIAFHLDEDQVYRTTLIFAFNRPVELYEQEELTGHVQIDLEDRMLSGMDITLFDAVGNKLQAGDIMEKKSQVRITFDHIILRQVFKRREFHARRELEFEGVRPGDQRLDDIQGMLADLGLENITRKAAKAWIARYVGSLPAEEVMENLGGYYILGQRSDGLRILLEITGKSRNFARERKEGERIDRVRVESGRMHIAIHGRVEGELRDAQELSRLLNDLQRLLKERFSYMRAQVA
jgi:hypothetical protein